MRTTPQKLFQVSKKKRQYPRTLLLSEASSGLSKRLYPVVHTAPSTGSGNTFDYAQGAVVTLSLTQGLYRNKIPVFKTSLFRLLFRFVAFSATPSAGSNYFYIMWDYVLVFAVFKQKSIGYSSKLNKTKLFV